MTKSKYKKGGINITAILCAVIIAVSGVLVTLIGVGSSWFTNPVIASWFGSWGKDKEPPELPELKEGSFELNNLSTAGTAAVAAGESTGIAFQSTKLTRSAYASAGVPDEADTAFTLTATIQPEYATNKTVDWFIEFVDSASLWASGKTVTDYMTITPNGDGALTATAVCTKAFAERIKITVVSRDNAQIKAHCIVNYEEKITDVHLTLCGGEVDKTSLVGTWRLGDPSSSGFQYACSSSHLGSNWNLQAEYATSDSYTTRGFTHKWLFSKTGSNSVLTGLWFAVSSSPDWSIMFAEMTEPFYLYIKSADTTSVTYTKVLNGFNAGLFVKVSDNVGLENTDKTTVTETLYGGSNYNFTCDLSYSEYTTPRKVSLTSSVCAFGLVDNFNELIGLTSENSRPVSYFPVGNLILSPTFTFDISMLARMLAMPDSCFNAETNEQGNKVVNETGKSVLSEVINKIKETGTDVNLAYLKLALVDEGGTTYYFKTFYFALDIGTLKIPVEDITISDTEITI